MPKVPRISGRAAVKAFQRAGFEVVKISGSHHNLKKDGVENRLSIPVHNGKVVGPGLLKSQIDAAGMTVDQFIALL